jgi:hypothetical protein
MAQAIARGTLEGVVDADITTVPVTTDDGLALSLLRFRRGSGASEIVLLNHGLTASTDMFIMPEHHNLVTALLDAGYEVWSFDSRMSNRHAYNDGAHEFTLDHVARFDHPAALRVLRDAVGSRPVHVVAHCLGSVSFLMSVAAGFSTGVTTVTANSVALVQQVPWWSRTKLRFGPNLMTYGLGIRDIDPNAGSDPWSTRRWLLSKAVSLAHQECDVSACHLISFMWGTGWPNLYQHENLDHRTHQRIGDLLGASGLQYYRHVRRMVSAGHAVRYDDGPNGADGGPVGDVPVDYLDAYRASAQAQQVPVLFLAGTKNHTFLDSNVECFKQFDEIAPNRHELRRLPGYGHIDPFIGKDAATDVFPVILDFLGRHRVADQVGQHQAAT